MTRVLVTEQLAARGIEALSAAGLEVDERLGLDPDRAARGACTVRPRSWSAARRR